MHGRDNMFDIFQITYRRYQLNPNGYETVELRESGRVSENVRPFAGSPHMVRV